MSGRVYDDGVIDPRDTRTVLGLCLWLVHRTARPGPAEPAPSASSGCEAAMITRLLVANRGEIARRVFATCRGLGIATVAVVLRRRRRRTARPRRPTSRYGCPGRADRHVPARRPDRGRRSRRPGPTPSTPATGSWPRTPTSPPPSSTPGLTWVGPPPKAIAAMGSKVEAKALLAEAGVPMLPSWTDPIEVTEFPVLVKASAGGGGRGMRHRPRRPPSWPRRTRPPGARRPAAFGDGDRLLRAVRRDRSPHRGAGLRRHATAPWSPWASASARSSAATRRSSRRPRRRRSVSRCGPGWPRPPCRPPAPSATSAPARSSSCSNRPASASSSWR